MNNLANLKRKDKDISKLLMQNYDVLIPDESKLNEIMVVFKGPKDTPYADGYWKINVTLQDEYPYKSPSIGFSNKIYHPNIDERSGSVCLDVINQSWSPMYDLTNIFESFLPFLLAYPNETDPLNHEAAKLYKEDKEKYELYVKEHVKRNANEVIVLKNDKEKFNKNLTVKKDDDNNSVISEASNEKNIDEDLNNWD